MIGVAEVRPSPRNAQDLREKYLHSLALIERLHRQLLDVIKDDFERRGGCDINSVQALLLFNIGDEEMTAGELRSRGHYLGSNVSYNLKKLVDGGYIHHQRSDVDRRSVRVRLTDTGREVHRQVDELFQRHLESVEAIGGVTSDDLHQINQTLMRLERFWADQIRYRL
jgi:DNA-binding MarR family transcriptional regulator